MVFTTQVFIFLFLPCCLLCYFLAEHAQHIAKLAPVFEKFRIKDLILIVFSFGFYMWSCFDNGLRLLAYIIIVYLLARCIESSQKKKLYITVEKEADDGESVVHKRVYLSIIPFVLGLFLVLFCLIYYKYSAFLAELWNEVFGADMEPRSLLAPLGLSFITFSAISYLADIYRGRASAGSFIDCALYLTFFPKVVSGPIVLWKDFQKQIPARRGTLTFNTEGVNRIIIGLAKKVLLADTFGACIADIGVSGIDRVTALGTLLLYMLQIYYDFAGYSDIAIGLARLFSFDVQDNFNFPYRSKSISEFWRRWHISLGAWFREYVYFPLGGSRVGLLKTLRNLAIVFALTGIWHGAGWNYIIWGAINGALVVLERVIKDKKVYQKTPNFVKHGATMMIVMLFWQLFRFQKIEELKQFFGIITGKVRFNVISYTWQHFFDARLITFVVIAILGATLLGEPRVKEQYEKLVLAKVGFAIQELVLLLLLVLSVLFIVNSTYSPFIYFQY